MFETFLPLVVTSVLAFMSQPPIDRVGVYQATWTGGVKTRLSGKDHFAPERTRHSGDARASNDRDPKHARSSGIPPLPEVGLRHDGCLAETPDVLCLGCQSIESGSEPANDFETLSDSV